MKKYFKNGLSILSVVVMTLSILGGITVNNISAQAVAAAKSPRIADDGTVTWDKVKFGNYYQDSNGSTKTPIEWRVLSIDGNDAFLIADKVLDCQNYNTNGTEKTDSKGNNYTDYACTWKDSTLRQWLNGEFYTTAFNSDEQAAIIEMVADNNGTKDRVSLPDLDVIYNTNYGFDAAGNYSQSSDEDWESETRAAKATDYAISKVALVPFANYNWFLNARDNIYNRVVTSNKGDTMMGYERYSDNDGIFYYTRGVRPIIHVSASKISVSGTVTAQSKIIGKSNDEKKTTEATVSKPSRVIISSAKNSKKKTIVIKWKKVENAKGYQVEYALNSKFTKSKKTKILNKLTLTAKKLKKGKTYYIRVRAYNTDSSKTKLYGNWSKVKKVKIKK